MFFGFLFPIVFVMPFFYKLLYIVLLISINVLLNIYHRCTVCFPIGLDFLFITFPSPGVLMKRIGAEFYDRLPFLASTTGVGCSIK